MSDNLPPSMYGGGDGDYDFDNDYLTENFYPQEIEQIIDIIEEWSAGDGFTAEDWLNAITQIDDIVYDDDGNIESFDFDFETDDGYSGSRHARA